MITENATQPAGGARGPGAGQGPGCRAGPGAACSLRGVLEQRARKWPRKPQPGQRRHLKTTRNLGAPAAHGAQGTLRGGPA